MRHLLTLAFFVILSFGFPTEALAQSSWVIDNFTSEVIINQDTSITVEEIIEVDFMNTPKHGIFRNIPVAHSARGKNIKTNIDEVSVRDLNGLDYPFSQDKNTRDLVLKIGDPSRVITGKNTYVIRYRVSDVLQKYDNEIELYWNVLGSNWDVPIRNSSVRVLSPHALISQSKCFTGILGSTSSNCTIDIYEDKYTLQSTTPLGNGSDFTIVLSFDPDNNLVFPTQSEIAKKRLIDNWGYILSVIPLLVIFIFWIKKGRDKRYVDDNIYDTKESDSRPVKTRAFFERKFMPLVYRPIDNLSPAEIGVISDDKIHLRDIIAEVVELARLGFIRIEKFEIKKKLRKDEVEYAFLKEKKYFDTESRKNLKDYQDYILKELFRATSVHKSVKTAEKLFGAHDTASKEWKLLSKGEYVLLSGLRNHFYEGLPIIKEKVYRHVSSEGYFDMNPEHVRMISIALVILMNGIFLVTAFVFASVTGNYGPVVLLIALAVPCLFLAYLMPRRSARGYAYLRQIEGLKWYLQKGKWRHEISEKKLFFEDILPLAIALGVVGKLAKDMQNLEIVPPKYINGFAGSTFTSDFGSFNNSLSSAVVSSPRSSGGSWSGGSGFSGGSSGGGFGGGGGGSW